MGPWLLDVNVLLAWRWPKHPHHARTLAWLKQNIHHGCASCPLTELGFLRIVSNPAFSPYAPSFREAHALLKRQMDSNHTFWQDDLSCASSELDEFRRVSGHRQITDAYLLSLAVHHQGCFVTHDRKTAVLAPVGSPSHAHLLILH